MRFSDDRGTRLGNQHRTRFGKSCIQHRSVAIRPRRRTSKQLRIPQPPRGASPLKLCCRTFRAVWCPVEAGFRVTHPPESSTSLANLGKRRSSMVLPLGPSARCCSLATFPPHQPEGCPMHDEE